jgi:hypothetical protein
MTSRRGHTGATNLRMALGHNSVSFAGAGVTNAVLRLPDPHPAKTITLERFGELLSKLHALREVWPEYFPAEQSFPENFTSPFASNEDGGCGDPTDSALEWFEAIQRHLATDTSGEVKGKILSLVDEVSAATADLKRAGLLSPEDTSHVIITLVGGREDLPELERRVVEAVYGVVREAIGEIVRKSSEPYSVARGTNNEMVVTIGGRQTKTGVPYPETDPA